MPVGAKISIIGAGSLRSATPVLSSIFNLPLTNTSLYLCDVHKEALDLFGRFARILAAAKELEIGIGATSDIDEAVTDADTIILCFGLGEAKSKLELWSQACTISQESYAALARAILLHPVFESINELLYDSQNEASVVNLVSPVELSSQLLACEAVHLDWPPPISLEERVPIAHQVLRWVRSEDHPYDELRAQEQSPLITALLDKKPAPQNLFNTKAVTTWISELEEVSPGCGFGLLAL